MTNIQTSEAPSISRGSRVVTTTDVPDRHEGGHGRRNLILGLVAAAVAALAVGGVLLARASDSPSAVTPQSPLAAAVQVMDAYAPGGSVYEEQVPVPVNDQLSAYQPGGSVYEEQVPVPADDGLSAYQPGGSVYEQQVPQP